MINWAESQYPDLFPQHSTTETLDIWRYRYYPQTNLHTGVNNLNEVYVLGDVFGGMQYIGKLSDMLALVPGDTTTSSEEGLVTAGSGACHTNSLPSVGAVSTYQSTSTLEVATLEFTETVLEASASVYKSKVESNTNISGFGASTVSATTLNTNIVGDFYYRTSINVVTTTSTSGFESSTEVNSIFVPQQLSAKLTACEGDVLRTTTGTVNSTTTTNIFGTLSTQTTSTQEKAMLMTTESVNDQITTPAGSFSTVRTRDDLDNGTKVIHWMDKATSRMVKTETYNASGTLINSTQLTALIN